MAGGQPVLHPAERQLSALQRRRQRTGPDPRSDQRPLDDEHVPRHELHLQQSLRLPEALRPGGLLPGRGQAAPRSTRQDMVGNQLRAGRPQLPTLGVEGAGRRRHQPPVQPGRQQHAHPHLRVPRRHVQEGARARGWRSDHHPRRLRLHPRLAGRPLLGKAAAASTTW